MNLFQNRNLDYFLIFIGILLLCIIKMDLCVIILLSAIGSWAIWQIIKIFEKVFNSFKSFRDDIKNNETELNKLGMNDTDKEKKKEYDKAINRILESENLMIIGRYLTIVISALLLVLVVVIVGLVIIIK